jgi:hypothetical protein
MPSYKKVFDCPCNHWYTVFFISSSHKIISLLEILCSPEMWKPDGTKSGLWAVYFMTSYFNSLSASNMRAAIWGQVLSCNDRTISDSLLHLLELIAGFSPIWSMSQLVCTYDSFSTFQVGLKIRPLRIPEDGSHQLACRWLHLESLCSMWWWMLLLHGLLLGFWLIMVNPSFIVCENPLQKIVTFFAITSQMQEQMS